VKALVEVSDPALVVELEGAVDAEGPKDGRDRVEAKNSRCRRPEERVNDLPCMRASFSLLPGSRDPNGLSVRFFRRGQVRSGPVAPHFQTQQTRSCEPESANDKLQL
jgi:hypothetical protein